jgi:hypothetical protein
MGPHQECLREIPPATREVILTSSHCMLLMCASFKLHQYPSVARNSDVAVSRLGWTPPCHVQLRPGFRLKTKTGNFRA